MIEKIFLVILGDFFGASNLEKISVFWVKLKNFVWDLIINKKISLNIKILLVSSKI